MYKDHIFGRVRGVVQFVLLVGPLVAFALLALLLQHPS